MIPTKIGMINLKFMDLFLLPRNFIITYKKNGSIITKYKPTERVKAERPANMPIKIKFLNVKLFNNFTENNNANEKKSVNNVSLWHKCAVIKLFGFNTINACNKDENNILEDPEYKDNKINLNT